MSTQTPSPITALLKQTIIDSGIPYKALERDTGVKRASIQRFVDGRQSIRLDIADRLAVFFGLSLVESASFAGSNETKPSKLISKAR